MLATVDNQTDELRVRTHLEALLESSTFARTPRLREFLRFVVGKTLAGEEDEIKEYLIATAVYRRGQDYDPQIDSTVRVEASRLRAKLREYYEHTGSDADVEIQLPKGSYVPVFVMRRVVPTEAEMTEPVQAVTPNRRPLVAWVSLAAASLAGAVLWIFGAVPRVAAVTTATAPEPHVLEEYLRAQKLLRTQVFQNGWPASVPPPVAESIRLFEQVTQKSPKFVQAWVALAEAQEWAYELDRTRPKWRIEAAERALDRALSIAPGLSDAWARLGSIYFHRNGDLKRAEEAVRRAIDLNPRDVASHIRLTDLLRIRGEFAAAQRVVENALAAEPANPRLWALRALVCYDQNRYDEALAFAEHGLSLAGGKEQPLAWWAKGLSLERLAKAKEAETAYRAGMSLHPQEIWNRTSLAHLLAVQGKTDEASAILKQLEREQDAGKGISFQIAVVCAGLARNEEALRWLERGRDAGETSMPFLRLEKRFEKLHGDGRFRALLDQGA